MGLLKGKAAKADPAQSGRAIVQLATRIGADPANRDESFAAITETAAALLQVDRVGIWLYDEARTRIECADLFEAESDRHSHGFALDAAEYPKYFRSLENERILAANDAHTDPRTEEFTASYLRPLGIGAMLDAPIRVGGTMAGVVCHEAIGGAREWTVEERALAASMGDFVSLAIESAERARSQAENAAMAERLARVRKMEALGRLAGSVAHDFNNLLTAIQGSVDLIRRSADGDNLDVEFLAEELDHVNVAIDRAGRLIQQLLGFSRHEHVHPQIMNAAGAIQGMQPLLARVLGDCIDLELRVDERSPKASFDPKELEHLMLNLASNARDAMPNGGKLRITMHGTGGVPEPEWLEIEVLDSGEGIPQEVLPLIFEPFYSTKVMGTGWGLGLATVQRLIESAGGHIFVRSQPGEGTVFRIRLPAVNPASADLMPIGTRV